MNIVVNRIGFNDYHTELFHLFRLFFEDVELGYEPDEKADYTAVIDVSPAADGKSVRVNAELTEHAADKRWQSGHERTVSETGEDSRKRSVKRAISYALLQLLQNATGVEQPWGILTGVRPTKLLHNLMRLHDPEESRRILQEEYLVTADKARLLTDIALRQLTVIPDLFDLDNEVSIYIGIPFCPTKCAYCTFPAYDIRGNNGSVDAFLEGLHYEIRETGRWLRKAGVRITTLYWGGGTPTSIEAEQMDALFHSLHEWFPGMDMIRELTVEAGRPDTITPDKLDVMKKWGVDRISINPQSFTQATLDRIGRDHTVSDTVDKFILSREMGMHNINMDLIIGLPNEGVREFRHTLNETARLLPESLTVHTLAFKRASKMTKDRGSYEVAERGEIGEMMRMAADWTAEHSYVPYYLYRQKNILGNQENVGYSLAGKESLYNILMMEERQTIIGLGCGAVSKILYPKSETEDGEAQKIDRFPNPKEPTAYNNAYKQYVEKKLRLLDEAYHIGAKNDY